MPRLLYILLLMACPACGIAQHQNAGWIFISHTQKLNKRWDVLLDVQARTADRFQRMNTLLLRGGLNYRVNEMHAFAFGYASKNDWEQEGGVTTFVPEHRVYQQYLFQTELGKTAFTVRGRYEERFVRKESRYLFSQRARAFAAFQLPVFANQDFTRGPYINFQDEIFLNVAHKSRVNNAFLDQNRALASLGYRFSKKLDAELGYMWWLQRETDGDVSSNVFQLMLTTSF